MNFEGKRIAVVGAGVEGISTVRYLLKKNLKVHIFDKNPATKLPSDVLREGSGITTSFGSQDQSNISSFEIIFRSPGIRPDYEPILAAEKKGAIITSQTKLFFDLCRGKIIGITGTKGKGTTASLLTEILRASGRDVFLGGNIGKAPLDFIDHVTEDSFVVLELSSFQLMDLHKSPFLSVVLMVTSEHLDYHKDKDEYIAAKANIASHQKESYLIVANYDFPQTKKIASFSKAKKYYYSTSKKTTQAYLEGKSLYLDRENKIKIVDISEIHLIGEHNVQNVLAASLAADLLGVSLEKIRDPVRAFPGLEHRLEFVKEVSGVKFINDSASTIPETTVAAIKSIQEPKILILGGSSKNSDFSILSDELSKNNVKAAILMGAESERILNSIKAVGKYTGELISDSKSLQEAVQKSLSLSKSGEVILLSPGCASFGQFKNYQDRGQRFKEIVSSL